MKLVIVSDTHNRHRELTLPDGDVLIHCGDFSMLGQSAEVIDFLNWFNSQPHKTKLFIAGNHDRLFQQNKNLAISYLNASNPSLNMHYLEDSGVVIEGVSFWGVPWTPKFGSWSFMLSRGQELAERYAKIPTDTDVLVTHGPPKGILDLSPYGNEHAGCDDLFNEIVTRVRPRIHCFGHIHAGYGTTRHGHVSMRGIGMTDFVNAAICDEEYNPVNLPMEVEI